MTYQTNKLDKFRLITEKRIVISMLLFTAEKKTTFFCHTKLQTVIIEVVLSKFLYLIVNWTHLTQNLSRRN